ncbi:uncharacterized protein I206_102572 [Kwoniella pini CBS 10737]|uniref:Uncharacterized protein n=1 Tax=Kwoniella pini CBS 10737 TaxID=1296096 RepID=A0A1B9I5R4_9TREE|nr:uncharacterized protein I206_02923 [Kwoniella pini CBS 10737]OCF50865.1 hypothetical protein I206_02923 [Kwoniella pini CBS 10737]
MPSLHQLCPDCGLPRASPPPPLDTMFEEDFERCFICEKACKGLYCSSECRLRDQGTPSPAIRANRGPVKITSQLPAALSPQVRATQNIGRSPRVQPQNRGSSSISSGSSVSSSPLQSPQTNPSEADSPKRDNFDLPPPAYPTKCFGILPASVPMKIPALTARASPLVAPSQTPGSHGSTVYPAGASIDTLRFGRKPSAVNTVLSPNALIPRCACGKPANHRNRGSSKDRAELADSGFSRLSLGPSVISAPHAQEEPNPRSVRIVSESSLPGRPYQNGLGTPGRTALPLGIPSSPQVTASTSFLSRSRSDPIPSSLMAQRKAIPAAPAPAPLITNVITPSHRELSEMPLSPIVPALGRPSRSKIALDVDVNSPRRGRSRERQEHHVGQMTSNFGGPADREQAPSRSRTRRESRRRSDSRNKERSRGGSGRPSRERPIEEIERTGQRSPIQQQLNSPQILPSWSRRASEATADRRRVLGEAAPAMRRTASGGKKSPICERGRERDKDPEERKKEELDRTSKQLSQVFGVAAV